MISDEILKGGYLEDVPIKKRILEKKNYNILIKSRKFFKPIIKDIKKKNCQEKLIFDDPNDL